LEERTKNLIVDKDQDILQLLKSFNERNFLKKNYEPRNVFVINSEDVSDMQVAGAANA
jgi:hypothetical protein